MPAVVPEPSQARIASTPASQCPPGKICAAKAFHNKKGEIKKGYVGKYPRKYGLIWYSTSILGSWNSHRIWSALAAKYLKFTTHHTCQLMAIPQQQLGPIGIRHHYHHFLHMFAHGSKSSSSMYSTMLREYPPSGSKHRSSDRIAGCFCCKYSMKSSNPRLHKNTIQVELSHLSNGKDVLHVHVRVNDNGGYIYIYMIIW